MELDEHPQHGRLWLLLKRPHYSRLRGQDLEVRALQGARHGGGTRWVIVGPAVAQHTYHITVSAFVTCQFVQRSPQSTIAVPACCGTCVKVG